MLVNKKQYNNEYTRKYKSISISNLEYDIIIVGGGISGLYMAHKCVQDGYNVLLLEKENRLGGRIETKYNKGPDKNLQYDCGPARISSHHHRSLKLIKYFKLQTGEIQPFRKHRHINTDGSVILEKDKSSAYIKEIIDEVNSNKEYNIGYLQSITFNTLCNKILGHNDSLKLEHMFGYDAEFKYCNAYDAIEMFKRDFQEVGTYFNLKDGLESLINALINDIEEKALKNKVKIKFLKNQKILKFHFKKVATIKTKNGEIYEGKKLIWAIPKKALEEIDGWTPNQRKLFNTVQPISLHRIFCQFPYDKKTSISWLTNVDRTTTNNAIRQFIPIGTNKGFAQVSYSDSYYADYWKHYLDKGKVHLSQELLTNLRIVFPEISNIVNPTFIDSAYWPEGVHMWQPGVNSININKRIQHIGEEMKVPMYIIGEAYSMHQCWIEGALQTVDEVYKLL